MKHINVYILFVLLIQSVSLSAQSVISVRPLWTVNLGIRKNILKDKFSLYIYARDIFHTVGPRASVNSYSLYYASKEKNDSRMIGISISYRFNHGREIRKSQTDNRIEESKRIGL